MASVAKREKAQLVTMRTRRISSPAKVLGAPIKHAAEEAWIADQIRTRFERGDPITLLQVDNAVRTFPSSYAQLLIYDDYRGLCSTI